MSQTALVTADDLLHLPDDGYKYELVRGHLVRMSLPRVWHGIVALRIGMLLGAHAQARNLGVVLSEGGFQLESNPDTVRGPDVAFLRRDRIPPRDARGYYKGAPDLAVEVLSPDDRRSEIDEKVDEYLTSGTPAVLVVDVDECTVVVHRRLMPPLTLAGHDMLDLDDVVPEFRCRVAQIFE